MLPGFRRLELNYVQRNDLVRMVPWKLQGQIEVECCVPNPLSETLPSVANGSCFWVQVTPDPPGERVGCSFLTDKMSNSSIFEGYDF